MLLTDLTILTVCKSPSSDSPNQEGRRTTKMFCSKGLGEGPTKRKTPSKKIIIQCLFPPPPVVLRHATPAEAEHATFLAPAALGFCRPPPWTAPGAPCPAPSRPGAAPPPPPGAPGAALSAHPEEAEEAERTTQTKLETAGR